MIRSETVFTEALFTTTPQIFTFVTAVDVDVLAVVVVDVVVVVLLNPERNAVKVSSFFPIY